MRRFVLASVLALAGCSSGPMFTPEELSPLVRAAVQRHADNVAAPVDPRIAPIVEGTSPAGSCLMHMKAPGAAARAACTDALLAELPAAPTGVSPYQTGVRTLPDVTNIFSGFSVSRALDERIERELAAGRPAEAVRVAGIELAFATTLSRGHVPMLVEMMGLALVKKAIAQVDAMLQKLPRADRAALVTELDAAIAALPRPTDFIDGELEWLDAHFSVLVLGHDLLPAHDYVPRPDPAGHYGAPTEEAAVRLFADARLRELWASRCGGTTTLDACAATLPTERPQPMDFEARRIQYIEAAAMPTPRLREELIADETRTMFRWQAMYVRKLAGLSAELTALRARAAR